MSALSKLYIQNLQQLKLSATLQHSKTLLFISSVVIYLGGVVKTDDLVDALKNKYFKAAALDVTDPEPLPDDHPLLKLDNVIVVPHWGSATIQVINFHVL